MLFAHCAPIARPKGKLPMAMSTRVKSHMHFMGIRDCPECGDVLFAAERAEFVSAERIILWWRCDSCDHVFQTSEKLPPDPSARAT